MDATQIRRLVERTYRAESRRILAALIGLLGDFDLAEEALQDAFTAALEQWPHDGIPKNPRAWLVSAGRFRAVDRVRRRATHDQIAERLSRELDTATYQPPVDDDEIPDDRLRLIFTCCHPAINADAQVALTLREICGLTTEEVARAFLTPAPTLAQRIVRARQKIRDARIPYEVPSREDLPARLESVLHVVYLVFNEGYFATSGVTPTRADLCAEAIRLGRLLVKLLPEREAMGLLGLMLLHDARRPARMSGEGEMLLLEEQDRSLWDARGIAAGIALVERALTGAGERVGPYAIQAAIAAVHAEAPTAAETDWSQIVRLYDILLRRRPSPVVELNRAAAVAMREGPRAGLELIDAILSRGDLADYQLAHAARGDLLCRLGSIGDAISAYTRALSLAGDGPERRFLANRLRNLNEVGVSRTTER